MFHSEPTYSTQKAKWFLGNQHSAISSQRSAPGDSREEQLGGRNMGPDRSGFSPMPVEKCAMNHSLTSVMSSARLFVALLPPPPVQAELAALAAPVPGVRWTPAENIHLTLRFLGETDPEKQERFSAALAGVRVEPFILPVGTVGIFPTRGPAKVLWAGVGNGHTRLYQLRKQVDEALLRVDPAIPMPGFHPHFTLGRLAEEYASKPLARFLAQHAAFEAPPFRVGEVHLMGSELTPGSPPRYRSLAAFPLAAP
jgi:RNA 2',3'-cyclic 3'-phosphodiesterase